MSVHHARDLFDTEDENPDDEPRSEFPDGYHLVNIAAKETRREDGLTFNEHELVVRYRSAEKGQSRITCGWCGAHNKSRSVKRHIKWFHNHPCASQFGQAILEPVDDLDGLFADEYTRAA